MHGFFLIEIGYILSDSSSYNIIFREVAKFENSPSLHSVNQKLNVNCKNGHS